MNARRIAWSIVGLLSLSAAARAGPVTWQFAGQVTSVRDLDGLFAGAVEVGSPFFGSYTFESTTPDDSPDFPSSGLYLNAISDVHGEVGVLEFAFRPLTQSVIGVTDDSVSGGYDSYVFAGGLFLAGRPASFGVVLRDDEGDVLHSDQLLLVPPPLDMFERREFSISDPLERFGINGVVTQLVPEPLTLTLLALGALMLGSPSRRKTRRPPPRILNCLVFAVLLVAASHVQAVDCNNNGVEDACDLNCGAPGCVPPCVTWVDCNQNGIPDRCEIDVNSTAPGGLWPGYFPRRRSR